MFEKNTEQQKYQACMVLAGVGDVIGYKNSEWEWEKDGVKLHEQMMELTKNAGPLAIEIKGWRYSDDTTMHMATARGLLLAGRDASVWDTCAKIAKQYKGLDLSANRNFGSTTRKSLELLNEDGSNWNKISYSDKAMGCGGSMRSACIGLVLYHSVQKLVAVSIQAGRITHHNPVGYLGSMISSYFASLAVRSEPPEKWMGFLFEEALPLAEQYLKLTGREVKENFENGHWESSISALKSYCEQRNISMKITETKQVIFPQKYGVKEREQFNKSIAWKKNFPGNRGIDSVLIAYDSFLWSKGKWENLCLSAMLHGGDNDSTGTIASAWYGVMYGFHDVPKNQYAMVEDYQELSLLGQKLWKLIP